MASIVAARYPALIDIGIDIVHPGKYETLCGSDPSVCAAGLPEALDLAYSAIQFFSYGSASSIFYWDRRSKKFLTVPMSD